MRERTPYDEIDPPVRNLVRVLNRFPGVATYTSCGGHAEPQSDAVVPEGEWYVDFHIERTGEGHASLEFFAWVYASADGGCGPLGVLFEARAKPPHLNRPGQMVFYRWTGLAPTDPASTADAFAELLTELRRQFYVTAHQAREWPQEW